MRIAVLTAFAAFRCGCGADNSVEQLRVERPGRSAGDRACPIPAAAPMSKEEAHKIMHERHEGMEADRQVDQGPQPRRRTSLARPGRHPRAAATIADLAAKSRTGSRPAPGPNSARPEPSPRSGRTGRISSRRIAISRLRRRSTRPPRGRIERDQVGLRRPRQDLQGVPRQVSQGDASLSHGR